MTNNIVTLFGGNINSSGSNGNNGSGPPPLLPEPNDDGKRRRLWQLKGMDLWMKELSFVQKNLKDIDMLILA